MCCGQVRMTAFCPDCGAALDNPLAQLLAHVCKQAAVTAARANRIREAVSNDVQKLSDRRGRRIQRIYALADKWRRWEEALRAVVERGRQA